MSAERIVPVRCPHCDKFTSNPPAWLNVLAVLSQGRGRKRPLAGYGQIAKALGISRQRAFQLVWGAIQHGALEKPFGNHVSVFAKTRYGVVLHSWWKRAGWVLNKTVPAVRRRR